MKRSTFQSAFFNPRVLIALLLCAAAAGLTSSGTLLALSQHELPGRIQRTLTLQERVSYQRAIEEVYWRHRIWPKERPDPKPSLDAVISQAQLEKKVKSYLRNSEALEDDWQRPITAEQLQAEMDRMAQNTRQPEVLQELFEALGNDPSLIAECLARPLLAERLLAHPAIERVKQQSRTFNQTVAAGANYTLPKISYPSGGCVEDTWTPTNLTGAPEGRRSHTAVWTGSEMIVWGGWNENSFPLNTGGRYNPSTDSWTATSTTNAPEARVFHTAVWTGSEMIVWGGLGVGYQFFNTGARYNLVMDSWTPTSTTNAPVARYFHTAVWTGSQIIIWGGIDGANSLNTGGRYNPLTNSWTPTSTANAPSARFFHTAVWTGTQMVVWGGTSDDNSFNTGGRYDPNTNSWVAISTANAPEGRWSHTAVWTGSEMIVWGGEREFYVRLNSGGRYNPSTNSWTATSNGNAPDARSGHTAVWTGSNLIVWGGFGGLNDGRRYYPDIDLWVATSTTNAPSARGDHTAIWTGIEMIVWGGTADASGGRYCVPSGIPSPTPAPMPCPSGYAVCNGNDNGAGSLRQAIFNASSGDTITFAPSVTTVTLTSGELVIDKNLTITGLGANRLTVQRSPPNGPQSRIFRISSSPVTVSISGITISHGFLRSGPGGGGIFSAGVLTLTDCTISDNSTGELYSSILGGGGVMNDHGTMTITGCTIANNSAYQYDLNATCEGGGILNDSGSLIITNSTISGNSCSAFSPEPLFAGVASGGGISNRGDLQITSSTIADNSASGNSAFGGGINGFAATRTDSSIIALNTATTGGPDYFTNGGTLRSTGYNIIGNNAGAVINSQPTDQIGTPTAPIDPLLGPLADNGGPTLTLALQPGSPAINRGNPAAPPQDQRGYGRLGVPDVGAFEFNGIPPAPIVTTNPATSVASFSATLNGSVNPRESTTTVYFQYGLTTSYGSSTPMQTRTGNTVHTISANISGLSASTTYHFRIVAHSAGGTAVGSDRTFTTLSATGPPVVITNLASYIASLSARLNGSVDPHGLATTVYFQYGTTTSYGLTSAIQSKTGNTYQNVSANIGGLTASTTYHFRIVATNSSGTRYGSDRIFTTLSATGPPVVITNPASYIASFSARLNGSVDPHGLATTVYFQYGTTTSYGLTTAMQSKTGNTHQNVAATIGGLTASTTYHFRIVATNSNGTRYGSDRTFTTLSATGPPVAITNPATNVASSSATLNGSVDPHGLTTTVHFQYGMTTSYGHTTANETKTGNAYQNVATNISGLTASTTYHFRIVATNSSGTRYGGDRTFRTTL
jgi:N-acetylneuraminic acid mutarotase